MYTVADSENTDKKIPEGLATRLLEDISTSGVVCAGDILSIESEVGYTLFPAKIRNQLTSHKTSMGARDLIYYIKANTLVEKDITKEVTHKLIHVVKMLLESDIDSIKHALFLELDVLEHRYLPDYIGSDIMVSSNRISDVPVSHFCSDGILAGKIDLSDSKVAQYLLKHTSPVAYASLSRVIISTVDDTDIHNVNIAETMAYNGTIGEYIYTHRALLELCDKVRLKEFLNTLLELEQPGRSYGQCIYIPCGGKVVDAAVLKDSFILNFVR